jgi:hypothetical protein
MTTPSDQANLPAQIAEAASGFPRSFIPSSIKALDRLVGAAVDVPVAWLAQQKAKIDAQTKSYTLVEGAIAKKAADEAADNPLIVDRAVDVLVKAAYRKQANREQVGLAMIEDLRSQADPPPEPSAKTADTPVIDDDWLNVFERYAEDASSERMQKLWGRVLAGEIRAPGRYSLRTLRFLSEFSQADALAFSNFCESVFGDLAPSELVKPSGEDDDIRQLIYMESAGLIQGSSGLGLTYTMPFSDSGNGGIVEGNLHLLFTGDPGTKFTFSVVTLTPMGQELLALLPGRDARVAARRFASSIRTPQIKAAFLASRTDQLVVIPMEILWQEEMPPTSSS